MTVLDPSSRPRPHGCSWWAGGMLASFYEWETAKGPVVWLGQKVASWWERQGVPVERRGTVVLALNRDRRELDRFGRRTADNEKLEAAALATLEPDLASQVDQSLHFPAEAHLDRRKALSQLRDRLERAGVTFITEEGHAASLTFDCRGLAARDALRDLRGVKGEMVALYMPEVH